MDHPPLKFAIDSALAHTWEFVKSLNELLSIVSENSVVYVEE